MLREASGGIRLAVELMSVPLGPEGGSPCVQTHQLVSCQSVSRRLILPEICCPEWPSNHLELCCPNSVVGLVGKDSMG